MRSCVSLVYAARMRIQKYETWECQHRGSGLPVSLCARIHVSDEPVVLLDLLLHVYSSSIWRSCTEPP